MYKDVRRHVEHKVDVHTEHKLVHLTAKTDIYAIPKVDELLKFTVLL